MAVWWEEVCWHLGGAGDQPNDALPLQGAGWGHQDSPHRWGQHGVARGEPRAGDDAGPAAAVLGMKGGGGFLAISSD